MDWNKKIYPSDILRVIYGPFKPFMGHLWSKFESLRRGWANVVDIKWKGDHEDKFVDVDMDAFPKEDDYMREYIKETRRLFGRTLIPKKSTIPSYRDEGDVWDTRRPIKPPPPPAPPKKRSKYYTESMDALDRAERIMDEGLSDIDRMLEELRKKIVRDIDDMF